MAAYHPHGEVRVKTDSVDWHVQSSRNERLHACEHCGYAFRGKEQRDAHVELCLYALRRTTGQQNAAVRRGTGRKRSPWAVLLMWQTTSLPRQPPQVGATGPPFSRAQTGLQPLTLTTTMSQQ